MHDAVQAVTEQENMEQCINFRRNGVKAAEFFLLRHGSILVTKKDSRKTCNPTP